jgi:hypothetical protein
MSFVNRQKKPFSGILDDSGDKTEKKKVRLESAEPRRYKERKQPIKQIFLPETNPLEVEMADDLEPVKVEIADNLSSDIEMKADNFDVDVKMEDRETTCRACLMTYPNEEMQMLSYTYIEDIELGALYKDYVGYKHPRNESLLPTSICCDCRNDLLRFHDFRKKCRSNETKYLGAVQYVKSKGNLDNNQNDAVMFDVEEMVDPNYVASTDLYAGSNTNDSIHSEGTRGVSLTDKSMVQSELSMSGDEDQTENTEVNCYVL